MENESPGKIESLLQAYARTDSADEKLQESRRLLQDVVDNIPSFIYITDSEGRFLLMNRPLEKLFKAAPGELLGRTREGVLPREIALQHRKNDLEVLESLKPLEVEETTIEPDGVHYYQTSKFPLFDMAGKPCALGGISTDITGRRRMEEELTTHRGHLEELVRERTAELERANRELESISAYNRSLIDASLDPLVTIGPDGRITDVNEATEKAVGLSRQELIGTDFSHYFTDREKARAGFQQVFHEGQVCDYELDLRHRGGQEMPVLYNASLYRDRSGQVIGSFAAARDITSLKRAEQELREAEQRYRTVADFTYDWEYWEPRAGSFSYVSPSCERITGYTARQFLDNPGLLGEIIIPEDRGLWAHHQKNAHQNTQVPEIQFRITRRDGESRWLEHVCQPVFDDRGDFSGVRASNRDITERKQAEATIEASLREKEVLLREIHHRVKNNLNIVASLLSLQAGKFVEPHLKEALRESQSRIKSIALIHEKLYQTRNLATLDFGSYIHSIVSEIFQSYGKKGITFTITSSHVCLAPDTAIPLALIVNELVTNAFKYAFPGEREGAIFIRVVADEGGKVTMTVQDDGIGFPEDLDFRHSSSLGLELVTILTRQVHGALELSREGGTTFTISFTLQDTA